jgi:hypothetical protein
MLDGLHAALRLHRSNRGGTRYHVESKTLNVHRSLQIAQPAPDLDVEDIITSWVIWRA